MRGVNQQPPKSLIIAKQSYQTRQFQTSKMSCTAKIVLEKSPSYTYTNLDIVRGRVVVVVTKEVSVENIQIKLEGISTARVTKRVRRPNGDTRMETQTEVHDLLYDCDTLFPPDNIKKVTRNEGEFTLIPGTYDYEFEFKIPMNCYCGDPDSVKYFSNLYNSPEERYAVTSQRAQRIQQNGSNPSGVFHMKCPLPPSSSGTTGYENGFDIKYFLKATVRRKSMFRSNIREIVPLAFSNFDPDDGTIARYLQTVSEVNNRSREYMVKKQVQLPNTQPQPVPDKQGFFGRLNKASSQNQNLLKKTVPFYVDIRFTDKIMRLNQSPQFTMLLVTRIPPSEFKFSNGKSNTLGEVFISHLVITLIRRVSFRARNFNEELTRTTELRNLQRVARLDLANTTRNHEGLYEIAFPSELFEKMTLPSNELPPSFQTCNMTNTYSLKITLKLKPYDNSSNTQTVDFFTDVWVLSGLLPPFPVGNINQGAFQAPVGAPPATFQPPSHPPPAALSTTTSPQITSSTSADEVPIAHDNDNSNVKEQLPSYSEATSRI